MSLSRLAYYQFVSDIYPKNDWLFNIDGFFRMHLSLPGARFDIGFFFFSIAPETICAREIWKIISIYELSKHY